MAIILRGENANMRGLGEGIRLGTHQKEGCYRSTRVLWITGSRLRASEVCFITVILLFAGKSGPVSCCLVWEFPAISGGINGFPHPPFLSGPNKKLYFCISLFDDSYLFVISIL